MDEPLSKDQQDLASDNHKLIYSFAKQMGLDIEEYYGLLAIGLCKAAKTYDPNRGFTFSTYAYITMRNECYMYWRHMKNICHIPEELIFSYNTPLGDETDGKDYAERINDIFGTYQLDTAGIEVKEFIGSLTKEEKQVIFEKCMGYTQKEIAIHVGKCQVTVGRIINRIKEKWLNGNYRHL
jgi:RNA polymerase sigma factor (sigma-70 family)